MKIERISENQIRCTLTSLDLNARNMDLRELAYGSEKARNLFREMIQKASNEVGFEAEDSPLMVEAIPLSNESIMLVITKIEDPEELDTRFSKFAPSDEEEDNSFANTLSLDLLEGAGGLAELLNKDIFEQDAPVNTSTDVPELPADKEIPTLLTRIFKFQDLDTLTDAARITGQIFSGNNSLYKKPNTSSYYLVLSNQDIDPLLFSRVCNILAEYGDKVKEDIAAEAHYREHYDIILCDSALNKLSHIV